MKPTIEDVIRHAHQDKPESVKVAVEKLIKTKIAKHYHDKVKGT